MATPIVSQRSEKTRVQARAAAKRYRQTPKGKVAYARAMFKRYYRLKSQGLCVLCSTPAREGLVHCKRCSERNKRITKEYRTDCVARGLCPNCAKNPVLPAMKGKDWSFCESCYFRKTSIDCLKTAKHAEAICQKLRDQNYRCAYTGEQIILGLNDSLDHVLPISRFPELRHDPANTEWVTRKVNCMKWDSTREEFIATAYAVVHHYEINELARNG